MIPPVPEARPDAPAGDGALSILSSLAAQDPGRRLLAVDGDAVSRGELLARVAACSGALARQGIGPGDHVALILPNGVAWCVLFWAAVNLGAIPVPLDPQTGAWELENLARLVPIKLWAIVQRFRAVLVASAVARVVAPGSAVVTVEEGPGPEGTVPLARFLEGAAPVPVPSPASDRDAVLMLACTSGTTANPKLIAVPRRGFVKAQQDMAAALGLGPDDAMLLGMPLFHQGGFGMGLQALLSGAATHYRAAFDPESFLDTIERERITVVQLSATLAKILLSSPTLARRDLGSLRLAYFAGEVLPDEVARAFWERRGIRVVNVIGSSETGTMVMWDSSRDSAHPPSDFLPLPFTRALIAGPADEQAVADGALPAEAAPGAPGHLWVSTDGLLTEYVGNPRETARRLAARDGRRWFDTQDLALRLPDGRVRFVGRAKRVIKRGGNLVHPEELEAFLLTHPQVAAVAVRPTEHPLFGEAIVAHVQPAPGATPGRGELLAFCRGKLAAYKIPDRFELVDHLPADIGKIQHKHLRRPTDMPLPTLADHLTAMRTTAPTDRLAFACEEQPFTFGALAQGVDQLAAGLHGLGVGPGIVVGASLSNGPEALMLPLALWRLGAVVVPVFPMTPDATRCAVFAGARAALVVVDPPARERLAQAAAQAGASFRVVGVDQCRAEGSAPPAVAPLPDAMPAMIAASSGTTGIPKAVLLTRAQVSASMTAAAELMRVGPWRDGPELPSCMIAFPLSTSGVMVVLGILRAGSQVFFARSPAPLRFWQLAAHWSAQSLAAPPAYLEALLSLPEASCPPVPSVRAVMTGMDFLAPGLLARLQRRVPTLEAAANGYGLVETATVFMTWKAHQRAELGGATSVLSLCPGVDNRVEVRDEDGRPVAPGGEGELWASGPSVVSGYLGRDPALQAPFRDGWFRTGDLARLVAPGTVELLGRRKHLIKRGGKSVSPVEVEDRVGTCPGVDQAAVVGVPHPLYGEMIWAFVVPSREGAATVASIMRHSRSALPSHMAPDRVELVDALPRGSGAGKVDRDALVRTAATILARIEGAQP